MLRAFRFLLLDDDIDLRFVHRHALKKAFVGCDVDEVGNCDDALDQAARAKYDAVIADHQLSGQTGAECIQIMRSRGARCVILLVTSSDNPKVRAAAVAAGADRVFSPGDFDFVSFLRAVLGRSS